MNDIVELVKKKAKQSICKYKVAAIGLDRDGKVIGSARNRPRFKREGGSIHAEMALMARYGKNLHTIIICRINNSGGIKPIHPCDACKSKADELGIKIVSVDDL